MKKNTQRSGGRTQNNFRLRSLRRLRIGLFHHPNLHVSFLQIKFGPLFKQLDILLQLVFALGPQRIFCNLCFISSKYGHVLDDHVIRSAGALAVRYTLCSIQHTHKKNCCAKEESHFATTMSLTMSAFFLPEGIPNSRASSLSSLTVLSSMIDFVWSRKCARAKAISLEPSSPPKSLVE